MKNYIFGAVSQVRYENYQELIFMRYLGPCQTAEMERFAKIVNG